MVETEAQYKIESGVPLPPRGHRRGGLTAALLAMKPGDSVLLPGLVQQQVGGRLAAAKRRGMKFTTRTEPAGARVFCVESAAR